METALGLLAFGICGFLLFKAAVSFFRMWNPQEKVGDSTENRSNCSSFYELLWPFSLFIENNEENKETRQHFWDFLLYSMLMFFVIVALAFVQLFFE